MSRYIDAELLDPECFENCSAYQAKEIIDETPTADVVEVVRCKNCRFWEEYCVKDADEIALLEKEFGFEIHTTSACIGECQCKQWQGIGACGIRQTGHNDYCSYGERRVEDA